MPQYLLIECRREGCNDDPRSLEGKEAGVARGKKERDAWGWGLALAKEMAMAIVQAASEKK